MSSHSGETHHTRTAWSWTLLAIIIVLTVLIRVRLLDLPLDRDAGGYAYGAQEILRGGATYVDFYTMRYPAIFGAYAAFVAAFGETARAVNLGLLVVNALTTLFLFLAGRRLFNPLAGLGAVTAYSVLNLGAATEGFSANAEQFVVLFAAPGIWFTVLAVDSKKAWPWFAAGICFAVAYLMKQHGLLFVVFGGVMALSVFRRLPARETARRLAAYAAGAALPVVLTLAHLAATGRIEAWRYWTIEYAGGYATSTGIATGMQTLAHRLPDIVTPMAGIYALAGIGFAGLALRGNRNRAPLLVILLVCSVIAISIGFYYRAHYFRLLFPVVSLLAGLGAWTAAQRGAKPPYRVAVAAGLLVVSAAITMASERFILFQAPLSVVSRTVHGANPFPESPVIAEFLREHTGPDDTILVLGSEPQIYFYANRRAASPHIYAYQLVENHRDAAKMQQEYIAQIEAAQPTFIVYIAVPTSWLLHEGAPTDVFAWAETYLANHYQPAGLVDIIYEKTGPNPDDTRIETRYHLDESPPPEPQSPYHLVIYQRTRHLLP